MSCCLQGAHVVLAVAMGCVARGCCVVVAGVVDLGEVIVWSVVGVVGGGVLMS